MRFSLKINGLDQLAKDAQKIGGEMPELLRQAMVKATNLVKTDAQKEVRYKTGTLRRSIKTTTATATRGVVNVGEKYGIYKEEGTSPHIIRPKNKKMLAFKVNGKTVFARSVKHPGTRSYPFMEPAYRGNIEKILDEYEEIGLKIVKTLGD